MNHSGLNVCLFLIVWLNMFSIFTECEASTHSTCFLAGDNSGNSGNNVCVVFSLPWDVTYPSPKPSHGLTKTKPHRSRELEAPFLDSLRSLNVWFVRLEFHSDFFPKTHFVLGSWPPDNILPHQTISYRMSVFYGSLGHWIQAFLRGNRKYMAWISELWHFWR